MDIHNFGLDACSRGSRKKFWREHLTTASQKLLSGGRKGCPLADEMRRIGTVHSQWSVLFAIAGEKGREDAVSDDWRPGNANLVRFHTKELELKDSCVHVVEGDGGCCIHQPRARPAEFFPGFGQLFVNDDYIATAHVPEAFHQQAFRGTSGRAIRCVSDRRPTRKVSVTSHILGSSTACRSSARSLKLPYAGACAECRARLHRKMTARAELALGAPVLPLHEMTERRVLDARNSVSERKHVLLYFQDSRRLG